ncbi:MAG: NAD(P)/FAD-dependent oxidoreductase [Candidatus Bathyarchaeia archaeon]
MKVDILIIGAGALGLASAYHLKSRNPEKRVLVIDRFGGAGQGNSAKSEGAFRNVFTSKTNYLLADSTIDWFFHLQNNLGYDLKLTKTGYLWLFSEGKYNSLKGTLELMLNHGIESKIFEKRELKKIVSDLVTDFEGDEEAELMGLEPVDLGFYCAKCGSVDASSLVESYASEFLKLGGEIQYNTTVNRLVIKPEEELGIPGEPFVWQRSRIAGVETDRGEIEADKTVVAVGAWAERLLEPIGFDPFMRPKKRQLFVFKDDKLKGLFNLKGINDYGILPLTILPKAGVYLKAELTEGSIWLGCPDDLGRKFELEDDPQPEEEYYTNNIYHVLVKYFPCFRDLRPVNMWAGQYEINSLDMTPVVAPAPGMIYVGAASGSGIMKSDALGRIVAALYAGDEEAELYGGRKFKVADLGISTRHVEKEAFII